MKNINATNSNMLAYCEAIKTYNNVFAEAFEYAKQAIGTIPEEATRAFMAQYEDATGYPAEENSTKAGIVDVLAAKWLAKHTDEPSVIKWIHDLWSWHRLSEGWTYAPVKDKANKKNPCLKPFELLTPEEISWDQMFLDLYKKTIKI